MGLTNIIFDSVADSSLNSRNKYLNYCGLQIIFIIFQTSYYDISILCLFALSKNCNHFSNIGYD